MGRKIVAFFLTVFLILTCAVSASAEEFDAGKTGSISVTLREQYQKIPIAGAQLYVYYIATVGINTEGERSYTYTEAFADTGIALDDPEFSAKLNAYLAYHDVPAIKLVTDAEGTAGCGNLPLGLYFVRQVNTVEGFAPCVPFLVTIPMEYEDGYVYAVNASPKTAVAKLTDITVRKVWNTDPAAKAAFSVTVQLLCNGIVVETAILDDSNNWQITYTDMPESDAYSIHEVYVPAGFTATYHQKDYVFTVTNTSTLIQTGQLIWPIPVLAFAGIALIGLGSALLRKKREQDA